METPSQTPETTQPEASTPVVIVVPSTAQVTVESPSPITEEPASPTIMLPTPSIAPEPTAVPEPAMVIAEPAAQVPEATQAPAEEAMVDVADEKAELQDMANGDDNEMDTTEIPIGVPAKKAKRSAPTKVKRSTTATTKSATSSTLGKRVRTPISAEPAQPAAKKAKTSAKATKSSAKTSTAKSSTKATTKRASKATTIPKAKASKASATPKSSKSTASSSRAAPKAAKITKVAAKIPKVPKAPKAAAVPKAPKVAKPKAILPKIPLSDKQAANLTKDQGKTKLAKLNKKDVASYNATIAAFKERLATIDLTPWAAQLNQGVYLADYYGPSLTGPTEHHHANAVKEHLESQGYKVLGFANEMKQGSSYVYPLSDGAANKAKDKDHPRIYVGHVNKSHKASVFSPTRHEHNGITQKAGELLDAQKAQLKAQKIQAAKDAKAAQRALMQPSNIAIVATPAGIAV